MVFKKRAKDMTTAIGRKAAPARNIVAFRSYQSQAETLVKTYLLADPFIPYTSVFAGIFACKMVRFIDYRSFYPFHSCDYLRKEFPFFIKS